jgi:protein SMG6
MLFTNIHFDDFAPVLAWLTERLEVDGAEERKWIVIASINVGTLMEYGRPQGGAACGSWRQWFWDDRCLEQD